jgi:outer membrane protein OmpA-like peptidoglycan-associated protein
MKRHLLLSVICVLLASGVAQAQNAPGHYVVLFALGQSTLDSTARATIASAAQEFRRTGSAHIEVAGHTDTSGGAATSGCS